MIIAVINNKGGIGKTTCSTILSELAANRGDVSVLAVDVCGQQNMIDNLTYHTTNYYGTKIYEIKYGIGFVINNETVFEKIAVLPSADKTPAENKMKGYNYVVVDTPPNTQSSVIRKIIDFSDVIVVPFMLQKHAIYGLDEVFSIVPDDKDGFLICIAPRQLGQYEKNLLSLVENNFGNTLIRWPLLARIEKNIGLHRAFDYGLRKEERDIFQDTFLQIEKVKG